jgi:beta-propeller repeat-containing protein
MKYSAKAIRRGSIFALTLIGLLQGPVGPASVRRERVSAAGINIAPRLDHERSISRTPRPGADRKTKSRVSETYGRLPIRFEVNAGQTDAKVKFLSRGGGYNLFLTQSEAVLTLRSVGSRGDAGAQSTVRMKLIGADPASQIEGLERLPGRSHYIIGKDASRWNRNVASFAKVRYRSVYPGIDLIYYGSQRQIEYDFVVAPNADPTVIRLSFDGADQIQIDAQGDLVLKTADGEIRQRKPVAYQEVDGRRREVNSRYALNGKQEVGFELGEYDHTRPLVIDPVMAYSTYLGGGSDANYPGSIAVDAAGNAYVTGLTYALDFPTSNPLQPSPAGDGEVFVAKLNPEGSALVYSTYLGGSGFEYGYGIAVDEDGNAYVTGHTQSLDFPTKNPLQPALAGDDLFVTKLNADGSALVYSTHLGGTSLDIAWDLAIDNERNVYVVGETFSNDFPTVNPLQANRSGGRDVFAAKLNADGSALVYSTYLGGGDDRFPFDDDEDPKGIAVDRFGCLYVAGRTNSPDFPTANPLKSTLAEGDTDAFVTKISADGSAFVYSTYLGGGDYDEAWDLAVDDSGNAYVTGKTFSPDFPSVNPLQPGLSGTSDVFVTKINPTGSAFLYSTYLGGARGEYGFGIAVDSRNNMYVTGLTFSDDFPTLDVSQPIPDRRSDDDIDNGFVAKLKSDGSRLIYSTYLGGKGIDEGDFIAVDKRGKAYVFGFTDSDDVPTTPGAVRREPRSPNENHFECFITKISAPRRHHQGHDKDREDDNDGEDRHYRKARH